MKRLFHLPLLLALSLLLVALPVLAADRDDQPPKKGGSWNQPEPQNKPQAPSGPSYQQPSPKPTAPTPSPQPSPAPKPTPQAPSPMPQPHQPQPSPMPTPHPAPAPPVVRPAPAPSPQPPMVYPHPTPPPPVVVVPVPPPPPPAPAPHYVPPPVHHVPPPPPAWDYPRPYPPGPRPYVGGPAYPQETWTHWFSDVARIMRMVVPPPQPGWVWQSATWQGYLDLDPHGRYLQAGTLVSSGNLMLDNQVLDSLYRIGPLPPMPYPEHMRLNVWISFAPNAVWDLRVSPYSQPN